MPQLGESVTEGQIARWLKKAGDAVERYEPIVEVVTDKVNAEVPSPIAGTLTELVANEGDTVAVGELICVIAPRPEESMTEAKPEEKAAAPDEPEPRVLAGALEIENARYDALPDQSATTVRARATPAVRRLARENQLDLDTITGTGPGGRVTKKDVENLLATQAPGPTPASPAVAVPGIAASNPRSNAGAASPPVPHLPPDPSPELQPSASAPPRAGDGDQLIPLSPMRRAIAEHMVRSRQTSPHAWCATEIDMTSVVAVRREERERFKRLQGVDLTYVPFVIKAAVDGLIRHPEMNATFTAEGILRRGSINISVAIGLDDGLIVPVIRDADRLSLAGIAQVLDDLVNRARAGRLTLADLEGGTFCVNNPGTFGTVLSAPIINQPQAGIMTMEAIIKRPVVLPGDAIGIRSMMFACLSIDHRVIDGLQAAAFLGQVKRNLEAMGPGTQVF